MSSYDRFSSPPNQSRNGTELGSLRRARTINNRYSSNSAETLQCTYRQWIRSSATAGAPSYNHMDDPGYNRSSYDPAYPVASRYDSNQSDFEKPSDRVSTTTPTSTRFGPYVSGGPSATYNSYSSYHDISRPDQMIYQRGSSQQPNPTQYSKTGVQTPLPTYGRGHQTHSRRSMSRRNSHSSAITDASLGMTAETAGLTVGGVAAAAVAATDANASNSAEPSYASAGSLDPMSLTATNVNLGSTGDPMGRAVDVIADADADGASCDFDGCCDGTAECCGRFFEACLGGCDGCGGCDC